MVVVVLFKSYDNIALSKDTINRQETERPRKEKKNWY